MTEAKDRSRASRAFNARWLTPVEVAENFVPVPAFQKLVSTHHAALLGPRGSGKTTLLKMLTRPALDAWGRLVEEDPETAANLDLPSFEAVYLPSDVRWSIELSALSGDPAVGIEHAALLQRFLVTASSVSSGCEDSILAVRRRRSPREHSRRRVRGWAGHFGRPQRL